MADDPCMELAELQKARREIAEGKGVRRVQTGDEMVDFGRPDLAALDRLIADAQRRCDEANGVTRRRRYAKGARFRPY